MIFFQSYAVCIRRLEGFCCVQYQTCGESGDFSLDSSSTTADTADTGISCTTDYIDILGKILRAKDSMLTSKSCWRLLRSRTKSLFFSTKGGAGTCSKTPSGALYNTRFCGQILSPYIGGTVDIPICGKANIRAILRAFKTLLFRRLHSPIYCLRRDRFWS